MLIGIVISTGVVKQVIKVNWPFGKMFDFSYVKRLYSYFHVENTIAWLWSGTAVSKKAADPTFPSIGALGGQAFVRPLLYWAVYTLVLQDTELNCDLGGIGTRTPREKSLDGKRRIEMQHRSAVRYRLDHRGQLLGMVVLACVYVHVGLYTSVCPSIAPLGWVYPWVHPSPVKQWAPKAVSAQWRIGRKSWIGSKKNMYLPVISNSRLHSKIRNCVVHMAKFVNLFR